MALLLTDNRIPDINSYDTWEKQAYPLGNGNIGAGILGGIEKDRIQLNEKTLWCGGPGQGRDYQGGNLPEKGKNGAVLNEVRRLFLQGDVQGALALCDQLVGLQDSNGNKGYGFYLSFGNLYLDFDYEAAAVPSDYCRSLDLQEAVATISYKVGSRKYTRRHFTSYPDNVLVTQITVEGGALPGLEIALEPDNTPGNAHGNLVNKGYERVWETSLEGCQIAVNGKLLDNDMHFSAYTKVVSDGKIFPGANRLRVEQASHILILTSMATDYKQQYPFYRTGESPEALAARVRETVETAVLKSYAQLLQTHLEDYSSLFTRVVLDLGGEDGGKTTGELLRAYRLGEATKKERAYVETLVFQYGRYLTIAGSRKTPAREPERAQLPTNLQGMWVGANNSIWHADYHLNVNLQMNYWPTYTTNLAECAVPLLDYVEGLRAPGRVTAEIYAGIKSDETHPENGFMVHTQNNPFGWTCPGWTFSWGWSPAALPWILRNCYEYYLYTGDLESLRDKIYPMMKEAARFYDQFLIEDGEGHLVSAPAYSPEHGPYTLGNTYEHSLIWQLYQDTIEAAHVLGVDADYVCVWKDHQSRLKGPIEIGDDGQIKEWYEETTVGSVPNYQAGHRHISHLLGLYPGDLIHKDALTFREAAKVSLLSRGEPTTGWCRAQRALCYGRLGLGEKALETLQGIIGQVTYDNLFMTHPPFQIDANYGFTAAVAEMLVQSDSKTITLLPALPEKWRSGAVSGLVARGNYEVSMEWINGKLTHATVKSKNGGTIVVQLPDSDPIVLQTEAGQEYSVIEST